MPAITIPRYQPIGDIRNFNRQPEITPRQTAPVGVTTSQKAEELNQQANLQGAQTAEQGAQFAQQQGDQAQELLKPFEQLRKAREVMQATDIATNTQIEGRAQIQAMKSSGLPYTQWMDEGRKKLDELHQHALNLAGQVSPAAQEVVQQRLAGERLNVLSDVQHEVVGHDISAQSEAFNRQYMLGLADTYRTTDPLERAKIQGDVFGSLHFLETHGVLSPEEAGKRKRDWIKSVGRNDGVDMGVRNGAQAGFDFTDQNPLLIPEEKTEIKHEIVSAISFNNAAELAAQKAVEAKMAAERKINASSTFDEINKAGVGELKKIEESITSRIKLKELDYDDRGPLQTRIDGRRKELEAGPKETARNPAIYNKLDTMIRTSPGTVDLNDIDTAPGLPSSDRTALKAMLQAQQKADHFTKTPEYGMLMDEISAAMPDKVAGAMAWAVIYQAQRNDSTATPSAPPGDSTGARAAQEIYYLLWNASLNQHGVMSGQQVYELASQRTHELAKLLNEKKYIPGKDTKSLFQWQTP